jgi:hypothetical protein
MLLHGMLICISLAFLVPIIWMVITSLKANSQVFTWPPIFIPNPALWGNYPQALKVSNFGRYFFNTVFLSFWVSLRVFTHRVEGPRCGLHHRAFHVDPARPGNPGTAVHHLQEIKPGWRRL